MFRFSIRDVLWLTVVAGLGVGWWVDHRQLAPPLAEYRRKEQKEKELADRLREWMPPRAVIEAEMRAAIEKSAELGAPQPMPLPPGYGEKPDKD